MDSNKCFLPYWTLIKWKIMGNNSFKKLFLFHIKIPILASNLSNFLFFFKIWTQKFWEKFSLDSDKCFLPYGTLIKWKIMGNNSFQKLFLYHIKLPRFGLKSQQFSIFLQYLDPKILGKNSFGLRQMFSTLWDPNQVKNYGK